MVPLVAAIAQVIMSEWIWSITFGQYQAPVAIVLLCCTWGYIMHLGWLRSITMSFVTQIGAWILLGCVAWLGYTLTGPAADQGAGIPVLHPLMASIVLAGLYGVLQSALLYPYAHHLPRTWHRLTVAIYACQVAAACITYLMLPAL